MESEMNRNISGEPSPSGQNIMDQGARKMGHVYDKSARAINQTYDQAMDYGRNNPGKAVLIAFGAGIGLGMILLGSRRSRMSRYGEPLVSALSNMALEYIRTL
jgi:hypothetical protein